MLGCSCASLCAAAADLLDLPKYKQLSTVIEKIQEFEDRSALAVSATEAVVDSAEAAPSKLVDQLRREWTKLRPDGQLHRLPVLMLTQVLGALDKAVVSSGRLAVTPESEDVSEAQAIEASLNAALTAMHIFATERMPKQIYLEDVIEHIASLARFQTSHTIFPSYSPVAVLDAAVPSDSDGEPDTKRRKSTGKGRRQSGAPARASVGAVQVYNGLCDVVELLSRLLEIQRVPDAIVLQSTAMALSTFFEDGLIQELQQHALAVVRAVFEFYPTHRAVVVDDILVSLGKLPTKKRKLRAFKLTANQQSVQMVTALFMMLIQSCVGRPDVEPTAAAAAENGARDNIDADTAMPPMPTVSGTTTSDAALIGEIRRSYDDSERTAKTILQSFIEKCSRKHDECDYKLLLENLTEDLLRALYHPEWPAAETMLYYLVHMMLRIRDKDLSMRLIGLEAIGSIAAKVQQVRLAVEENTTSDGGGLLADPTSMPCVCSDICDDIHFSVQCGHCSRWFHGDCVRVDEENLPESWNCDDCAATATMLEYSRHAGSVLNAEAKQKLHRLQDHVLDYLQVASVDDETLVSTRNFYVGQWMAAEYQAVGRDLPAIRTDDEEERRELEAKRAELRGAQVLAAEHRSNKLLQCFDSDAAKAMTALGLRRHITLSRNSISQITKYLGSARLLSLGFENMLRHIVASLKDPTTQVRLLVT